MIFLFFFKEIATSYPYSMNQRFFNIKKYKKSKILEILYPERKVKHETSTYYSRTFGRSKKIYSKTFLAVQKK